MSWLSNTTGIGINPLGKDKIKIDKKKALRTGLTIASAGLLKKIPLGTSVPKLPSGGPVFSDGQGGTFRAGAEEDKPWWQDALGAVGQFIGGTVKGVTSDPVGTGMLALAAKQALDARNDKNRANALQDKALARGEQQWSGNAPLRQMGMKKLLNPVRPDLSAVVADPRNPYAPGYVPRVKRLPIAGRMK